MSAYFVQADITKAERESFISNLSGSTLFECILPLIFLPISFLMVTQLNALWKVGLISLSGDGLPTQQHIHFAPINRNTHMLEAICVIIPMIFLFTYPSNSVLLTVVIVIFLIVGLLCRFFVIMKRTSYETQKYLESKADLFSDRKNFISNFRGCMIFITIISILAVDFPSFDRRYAKTETFGLSLMDLGVGMFVLSSGLTSSRAIRRVQPSQSSLIGSLSLRSPSFYSIIMGIVRMVVLKQLNYQEHVSEYGVHWNFFISLTSVWLLADVLSVVFSMISKLVYFIRSPQGLKSERSHNHFNSLGMSIGVLMFYQWLLSRNDGQFSKWVFASPRCAIQSSTNGRNSLKCFFASNREGVLGVIPLTVLFLSAEAVSSLVIFAPQTQKRKRIMAEWFYRNIILLGTSVFFWFGFVILDGLVQKTSRRLTNATYVFFVLAVGFSLLTLSLTIDLVSVKPHPFSFFKLLSDYQLHVFVLANLLTGAVNLSIIDPLHSGPWTARTVLFLYISAVTLAVQFFFTDCKNNRSKSKGM